jgi:hypothetical protein
MKVVDVCSTRLLRHSARASSNCSTKVGSAGLPMFALGETMYRAALPNFRSSSSDIFVSRVRNASTQNLNHSNK